jgi:hypothetical protein
MQAIPLIAMHVTVFDMNIVTDLKADSVSVVIPSFNVPNREAIAVLQENVATIISIEVAVVRTIAVEAKILNHNVRAVLAG